MGEQRHPAGGLALKGLCAAVVWLLRCVLSLWWRQRQRRSSIAVHSVPSLSLSPCASLPAHFSCLQVSDGELRQPGPEIMRKLSGAKDKLGWVPTYTASSRHRLLSCAVVFTYFVRR